MRTHDKAVYDWLGTLLVDYGDCGGVLTAPRNACPVLRVFASPQRAFATIVDLLVSANWIAEPTATEMRAKANDFPVLPLPLISIERDEPVPDTELAGAPKTIRQQHFNQVAGAWMDHPFPAPYKTDYRLTVWSNKKYTDAFIKEWLYAQLGNRGSNHNEMFLPVEHRAPYGTWIQSFKFNGSSNFSDLEGEEQRFMRFEYGFTLRTWIVKNPAQGGIPLDRIGRQYEQADKTALEETGRVDIESMNMFILPWADKDIPSKWPKSGTATVARSTETPPEGFRPPALALTVTNDTDNVEILTRPILLNAGHAVVSIAFEYKATQPTNLAVIQTDPNTNAAALVFEKALPATNGKWLKVHLFTVVSQPLFTVQIEGVVGGVTTAEVNLYNVDVRHRNNLTPVVAPTTFVNPGDTDFVWSSLATEPYLVIGILNAAIVGSGNIQTSDDFVAPTFTSQQSIDSSVNVGFVFLMQPRAANVATKIPNSLGIASIRLQRYDGPYKGNEI